MRAVDPIDRIALMEKLGIGKECTVCEQNSEPYCKWKPDVVDVCEAICTAPTIEPRCETCEAFNKTRLLIPQPERKKGKWINIRHDNVAECDQCGITGRAWMNFCFLCGADMRTPVETARDIVHKAIDNSAWSDTVDTAKMHKVVDDKYAEMTKKTEESNRCDTCKHEKERWFSRCADCSDFELWEGKTNDQNK